jgi:hypothetical protein
MYYASIGNRGTGFTNQIFALITSILLAHKRGEKVIVVDGFLDDIHTSVYTPLHDIFDLSSLNDFLKKNYGVLLADKQAPFEILSVRYGMGTNYLDITDAVKTQHHLRPFNAIKGDPCPGVVKQCILQYRIQGEEVEEIFHEHQYKNFRVNLNGNYVFTFGWINTLNETMFTDILKHITYHPDFTSKADLISSQITSSRVNVLHLRVEDDAIAHWSKQNHMAEPDFKTYVEDKYIELCKTYLSTTDETIVVSASASNRVIDFLHQNHYSYRLTPKFFKGREKNAIVDLLVASRCNHTFIGNFNVKKCNGSSFSYYIGTQLRDVTHVYIDLDHITDPEVNILPSN